MTTATMRAISQDVPGGPEVLKQVELEFAERRHVAGKLVLTMR